MPSKNVLNGGVSLLLMLTFLFTTSFALTGCRTKCEEGSADYPECLGGDVAPTKEDEEDITIVFWNLRDPSDAFKGQIQSFESSNKNVDIEYKTFHDEEQYKKLLLEHMAEGGGPDIFTFPHDWLPVYQDLMVPAPEALMPPDKFEEFFMPVAADVLIQEDEDNLPRVYGIPLFVDTLALYYNKEIFRTSLSETSKPADTWEGIKEQVYRITVQDRSIEKFTVSGIALGRGSNIRLASDIFSLMLLQEGAFLYDDQYIVFDEHYQESLINDKPSGAAFHPGEEAMKLYAGFANATFQNFSWNTFMTSLYPQHAEIGAFARGKTAMIFGYAETYEDIVAVIEGISKRGEDTMRIEDIGVVAVPQFEQATENNMVLARLYPLAVSRNSEHPELSWQFLLFLAGEESAHEYYRKTNKPTALQGLIESQEQEALFGAFARQTRYARVLPVLDQETYDALLVTVMDSIANSKMTIEEGLKKMDEGLQCVADKWQEKQKPLKKQNEETLGKNCLRLE